ncbi:DUF3098 domain-containing protein [Bacteroidetes bacterium SCGC AAA795-G10]|nr:DUF3098 domain-containing protein [Bacteroidetes bacterium SCGC AAA795-G10]
MKKKDSKKKFLFGKRNYIFLFVSSTIICVGFILMSGGGSNDPDFFNDEIFNFRRIRLAPTIVIIGFGFAILSIFNNPDRKNE